MPSILAVQKEIGESAVGYGEGADHGSVGHREPEVGAVGHDGGNIAVGDGGQVGTEYVDDRFAEGSSGDQEGIRGFIPIVIRDADGSGKGPGGGSQELDIKRVAAAGDQVGADGDAVGDEFGITAEGDSRTAVQEEVGKARVGHGEGVGHRGIGQDAAEVGAVGDDGG